MLDFSWKHFQQFKHYFDDLYEYGKNDVIMCAHACCLNLSCTCRLGGSPILPIRLSALLVYGGDPSQSMGRMSSERYEPWQSLEE